MWTGEFFKAAETLFSWMEAREVDAFWGWGGEYLQIVGDPIQQELCGRKDWWAAHCKDVWLDSRTVWFSLSDPWN